MTRRERKLALLLTLLWLWWAWIVAAHSHPHAALEHDDDCQICQYAAHSSHAVPMAELPVLRHVPDTASGVVTPLAVGTPPSRLYSARAPPFFTAI